MSEYVKNNGFVSDETVETQGPRSGTKEHRFSECGTMICSAHELKKANREILWRSQHSSITEKLTTLAVTDTVKSQAGLLEAGNPLDYPADIEGNHALLPGYFPEETYPVEDGTALHLLASSHKMQSARFSGGIQNAS